MRAIELDVGFRGWRLNEWCFGRRFWDIGYGAWRSFLPEFSPFRRGGRRTRNAGSVGGGQQAAVSEGAPWPRDRRIDRVVRWCLTAWFFLAESHFISSRTQTLSAQVLEFFTILFRRSKTTFLRAFRRLACSTSLRSTAPTAPSVWGDSGEVAGTVSCRFGDGYFRRFRVKRLSILNPRRPTQFLRTQNTKTDRATGSWDLGICWHWALVICLRIARWPLAILSSPTSR